MNGYPTILYKIDYSHLLEVLVDGACHQGRIQRLTQRLLIPSINPTYVYNLIKRGN